jgi:hypothetical protein
MDRVIPSRARNLWHCRLCSLLHERREHCTACVLLLRNLFPNRVRAAGRPRGRGRGACLWRRIRPRLMDISE